ncbi:amino acid adenylation domain protein (plasmid) [Gloeothece citriformis PCC 7424]|uniref:Amino acid adenylation domain protein n=1 Tax=Gloeothece citriformis (strain PCC 7424) TaxID=65393 RepID=B7KM99_GLOC7|nr:non-ribosomal peptide synthetase [Gloeothece citriformis]ACK73921.1 amino acid adenylation domain protein [Gloeothece citriformis PCC 7424]
MSDLLKKLKNLSPEKRQLVLQKLKQQQDKKLNNKEKLTLIPRSTEESIPLSFAQTRLWFVHQLEGASSAYTIERTLRLQGKLNLKALEQAFQALIQRHEPLRTQFKVKNNQPFQAIAPNLTFQLPVINLQHLSNPEQEISHLLAKSVCKPFDIANDSVLRVKLWQVAKDEYILLIAIHHIAADGWSMGILIRELAAYYQSFCLGASADLPPLPIQYADFAYWQRQWFTGEVLERQLNYWKQKLAAIPLLHQLPSDRPRPATQSFSGGTERFQLERELTEQLKKLSQRSGCTLFMTLLGAFAVLLSRYSGQDDIVIGSPIANRNRNEIEGLIGFFVNTLVLRFDLSKNPSFEEFLRQVRETTQEAYDYQDLPFEMLVEALQPERNLDRHPLIQIVFALQNAPQTSWDLPGVNVEQIDTGLGLDSLSLDLEVHLSEVDGTIEGNICYSRDLFDGETIARLMTHFRNLLTAIAQNPQQSVAFIPFLTSQEQQQLLKERNNTQRDYGCNKCIHQLVEEQAALNPEAIALVFENQSLTYSQLNAKANQLAHYLRELGIKTETLIGLSAERSLDMIIALLGILKAGAAYLPLDPEYPSERLSLMLEDSQVFLVLTQASLLNKLPDIQTPTLLLAEIWPKIASYSQENLTKVVEATNLAYVIYTSGSTGKPKGVMVEHRGVYNLAQAQIEAFAVEKNSRVLQFASFSFDACISEILMALGSGATLYLACKDAIMPGQPLRDFLRQQNITHVTLPPSVLRVLPLETLPALQSLIVAGEACSLELIKQWSGEQNFFNAYGPTEASVCATIAKCTPNDTKVTIGHPITNVQVYILDSHLQPVPIGVMGEIYIGGVGVARGYLNRPQLTQERFIADPFSNHQGRLYKTGDLGRYLVDGKIEYLGRIDHQVKVRGFRIELGEIEAILLKHPLVKEAVVIARTDYTTVQHDHKLNTNLIAYLVPTFQNQALPKQLDQVREFIQEKLPSYMIPQEFVLLDALPLTSNGKIDRNKLPTPDTITRHLTEDFLAPSSFIEVQMADIWSQILGIESIGVQDNFFKIGGHSLLATQLVSRIRDKFKLDLPLKTIFEYPILKDLANYLNTYLVGNKSVDSAKDQGILLEDIPRLPENSPKMLSFAQQRLWILNQLNGSSPIYNMPIALQLEGNLNIEALSQSLTYIVERHSSLRMYFPSVNGQPEIRIHQIEELNILSQEDLQDLEQETQSVTVQKIIDFHALEPFNLKTGTLFKAKLLQLKANKFILLINLHHIISDGWSMGIFMQELNHTYSAFSQGQKPTLPPLTIQYTDFVAWQRDRLEKGILETQINYWKNQLKDIPPLDNLLRNNQKYTIENDKGNSYSHNLNPKLTEKLKTLSQQQGVSLFMILLAAFSLFLSRYSGQEDICIGSLIANRTHSQTEGLIGFFINTLVLRSKINPEENFIQLLQQTRQTCLDAYSNQEIPFEYIVQVLHPECNLSYNPFFKALLVLQNLKGLEQEFRLPDLNIQPLEQNHSFLKFDLLLDISEQEDQLRCGWVCAQNLFEAKTLQGIANNFEILLQEIVNKFTA